MSQNGQTHFKNLAAFTDHFGTLCIKGLIIVASFRLQKYYKYRNNYIAI